MKLPVPEKLFKTNKLNAGYKLKTSPEKFGPFFRARMN
jgi:hypothetical protein